jgi:hypothetical protein
MRWSVSEGRGAREACEVHQQMRLVDGGVQLTKLSSQVSLYVPYTFAADNDRHVSS